ncbi:hypothetical protein PGTUg99_008980 [Puccinia graminis f. sp. tritici]|uniref:Uncharacterized protein n=1 Tax=Puccinia graminis f. sp. tritici TaxID=56615 RepID=A0A5B0NAB4_PUCGR|nr:hypothetical protein PGTUg99_008980 [Puccinia graminis f. sp. tritici]
MELKTFLQIIDDRMKLMVRRIEFLEHIFSGLVVLSEPIRVQLAREFRVFFEFLLDKQFDLFVIRDLDSRGRRRVVRRERFAMEIPIEVLDQRAIDRVVTSEMERRSNKSLS